MSTKSAVIQADTHYRIRRPEYFGACTGRDTLRAIRRTNYLGKALLSGLLATLCLNAGIAYGAADSRLHSVQGDVSLKIPQSAQLEEKLYIVQLDAPPAMVYHERREFRRNPDQRKATRAGRRRFDASDPEIQVYSEQLIDRQTRLLQRLGIDNKPLYRYSNTFNGFAVMMTEVQADKLRGKRGIAGVWKDRLRYVSTIDSPGFLGLNDNNNGLSSAQNLDGNDVIIGIIDSGIATDHPSFSDANNGTPGGLCGTSWAEENLFGRWLCGRIWRKYERSTYPAAPERWKGICQTGTGFDAEQCNNKIIGARFYRAGFEADGRATDSNEFISPKDADGHGTHIASIAAGNSVTANIGGTSLGTIRGMAPRARIAVYKACWLQPGALRASCSLADLQSAVEDAVADGVDIINYSVGDSEPTVSDPDDIALLTAADSGVFSAVAAGNDGSSVLGTINSPGDTPWVMTVAASSRTGREYDSAISVNSPDPVADDYIAMEASFTPTLNSTGPITAELLLADDGVTTVEDPSEEGYVFDACQPLINGVDMKGKVALISRGGCNFDQKIANAGVAGALAAIIYNADATPFVMDGNRNLAQIPAVMIGSADATLLLQELENDEVVEVTLDSSLFIAFDVEGNRMGSFSSTGPNPSVADILKPDITAPGVNILAGQTPDVANALRGEKFQYLSGTSMSVPHVAGVAALLKQKHPEWTPAEIKSALMTTARQNVVNTSDEAATPFDMGAGHLNPNNSTNPGLVYPADIDDYDAFLCGLEGGNPRLSDVECDSLITDKGKSLEAYNLNLPSIALSRLVSGTTVTRRVLNKGPSGTYTASVNAPVGIDVTVSPDSLVLNTDEEKSFTVTFTNNLATQNNWAFGSITWQQGSNTKARSPFAVYPVRFSASNLVTGSGSSGNTTYEAQFGYNGEYQPKVYGPVLPCVLPGDTPDPEAEDDAPCSNAQKNTELLQDDPYDFYELTADPEPWTASYIVGPLSATDLLLRVRLLNEDTSGDDDLDLYVYKCNNLSTADECFSPVLVAQSAGDTSDELLDIKLPARAASPPNNFVTTSGYWLISVHAFNTEAESTEFSLRTWLVGEDDAADMSVAPAGPTPVTNPTVLTSTVSWSGLEEELLLGIIRHEDENNSNYGITVIDIDARPED